MSHEINDSEEILIEKLDAVCDWDTFCDFVAALMADYEAARQREAQAPEHQRGHGAFGWQNTDIASYLECAVEGVRANRSREPALQEASWKTFAEFLYLGKIYE